MEVEEQTESECPEAWCHSLVRAHRVTTLGGMYAHTLTYNQMQANKQKPAGGLMNNCASLYLITLR